jgi:hypothetical protein
MEKNTKSILHPCYTINFFFQYTSLESNMLDDSADCHGQQNGRFANLCSCPGCHVFLPKKLTEIFSVISLRLRLRSLRLRRECSSLGTHNGSNDETTQQINYRTQLGFFCQISCVFEASFDENVSFFSKKPG